MGEEQASEDTKPMGLMEGVNKPVFFWSAGLTAIFVLAGVIWPQGSASVFSAVQSWIVTELGWVYLLSVAIFLIFMLYLGCSSYGRIKLGPNHAEPDYSYSAWFGPSLMRP